MAMERQEDKLQQQRMGMVLMGQNVKREHDIGLPMSWWKMTKSD
jgi:hypothetical protein